MAKRVCIVGSGNWACAIAKIVGSNTKRLPRFEDEVRKTLLQHTSPPAAAAVGAFAAAERPPPKHAFLDSAKSTASAPREGGLEVP
jgi:hypothetical protein